jgi:multicomponent Na+:H+ antiporter subunit C
VATTAVGLALVVRIHEAYGSIEEDEIHAIDLADDETLSTESADPEDSSE